MRSSFAGLGGVVSICLARLRDEGECEVLALIRTAASVGPVLVRAVLGSRVLELLVAHSAHAKFLAPDIAFDEAREHLPAVLAKRGKSSEAISAALSTLEALTAVIVTVPAESYLPLKDGRWRVSEGAIPMTGRCWQLSLWLTARSGPRTQISSVPASQRGQRPASSSSSPNQRRARTRPDRTSSIGGGTKNEDAERRRAAAIPN